MKFTKQNLKESMEFLRLYGNKPEFRSDEFRNFLLESFTEAMAEDSDTVGDFVTICLEAFQDFKKDQE